MVDASFVEDQDQWWMGGLHREVYVYTTAPVYLADIFATAGLENGYQDGRLKLVARVGFPDQPEKDWKIEAQLFDPKGEKVLTKPLQGIVPVGRSGDWPRLQVEFNELVKRPCAGRRRRPISTAWWSR